MQRVTLDSNVYVSAFTGGKVAGRILKLAEEGIFALQLSQPILDETVEVLERNFDRSTDRTDLIRMALFAISQRVVPHIELDVVKRDPDDNAILECAQASRSAYVVTADRDLLDLGVTTEHRLSGQRISLPSYESEAVCLHHRYSPSYKLNLRTAYGNGRESHFE